MRMRSDICIGFTASLVFVLLILDAKTALSGAVEGVELCIRCIIPSLFPFFLLSVLINASLSGHRIRFFSSLLRRLGIPNGAESLMVLGFLGGYPVGAQNINLAYKNNHLELHDAQRMLGFCNNAGPAFIFGILSTFFETKTALWALWGIHMVSAIFVGIVLPNKQESTHIHRFQSKSKMSLVTAMEQSIHSIALVCGWVIIFRILITFLQKWFLWVFPTEVSVIISGLLELSNGCLSLSNITEQGTRFILSAFFLSAGGICIVLQTISVTRETGLGMYFPGKLLQTAASVLLASSIQPFLFSRNEICKNWEMLSFICLLVIATMLLFWQYKKSYSFLRKKVV